MSTVTVDMKEYNSMKQQIGSFPRKLKAAARLGTIKSFSWGLEYRYVIDVGTLHVLLGDNYD